MFKNKNEPWKNVDRSGQTFDRKKITVKQNGRTVNLYELVQSRNVDTEIYPTLYKYGSLKPLEFNEEWVSTGLETLETIKDLDKLQKTAEDMFLALPDHIKAIYDYNYSLFAADKGKKILSKYKEQAKEKENESNDNTNDTTDNHKDN